MDIPFCCYAKNTCRMDDWRTRARTAMKEAGITQEDLAERLEMTQGGVQHWLAGTRQPSLDQINRIADILNAPRPWLTHGLARDDQLDGLTSPALAVLRRLIHAERTGKAPLSLWPAISALADMALQATPSSPHATTDPADHPPEVLPEAQPVIDERVREAQQRREQHQSGHRPSKRKAS